MKYFLDSADLTEITKWQNFVEGVTTNPILLGEKNVEKFIGEVKKLGLKVFIQIHEYRSITGKRDTDVIYKIPMLVEKSSLILTLMSTGFKTCGTMVYDIVQLNQAFNLGMDYCIVLHAKNENPFFIKEAVELKKISGAKTKLIAASFRTKNNIKYALLSGVDYATIPPKIMEEMFNNNQANIDYKKVYE